MQQNEERVACLFSRVSGGKVYGARIEKKSIAGIYRAVLKLFLSTAPLHGMGYFLYLSKA